MRKAAKFAFLVSSITVASAGLAGAVPFTGAAVGDWQNLQAPGSGNVYSISNDDAALNGAARFVFGTGSGTPANSFNFNGAGSDPSTPGFSTPSNTAFEIGSFSYYNGSTYNFPQLSTIDLGIALTLTSPVVNVSNFAYDFGIDLTPNNTGNPVLDGDIVTITDGLTSMTFTVGGTQYTLQLLGFSTNGGQTFTSSFLSPEESTANADIYATITTNVLPVPEPGTLALLGSGIAGLGWLRRRARQA